MKTEIARFCEDRVAIPMSKLRMHPVEPKLSQLLIMLMLEEKVPTDLLDLVKPYPPFHIAQTRCKVYGYEVDEKVATFLTVAGLNPGIMVMYLTYFAYKIRERGLDKKVDINMVCTHLLPNGLFDQNDLHEIWDSQKIDAFPDNALDHSEYIESLILK